MSIHTKLVGAFDAIILSLVATVTIVMVLALLVPSVATFETMGRGTVTIQQLAMDDTVTAHHI